MRDSQRTPSQQHCPHAQKAGGTEALQLSALPGQPRATAHEGQVRAVFPQNLPLVHCSQTTVSQRRRFRTACLGRIAAAPLSERAVCAKRLRRRRPRIPYAVNTPLEML